MLLAIQFPLADSRTFINTDGRTKKPAWPYGESDMDFVRFFGILRERRAGGLSSWGSENENVICEARRALTFCKNLSFIDRDVGSKFTFQRAFQRFYFDGFAVGKFEIGLATKKKDRVVISRQQFTDVIKHFLSLPIEIPNPPLAGEKKEKSKADLAQAGRHLSKLYWSASTLKQFRKTDFPAWLIKSGSPLLFLEYREGDEIEIPTQARAVPLPENFGLRLFESTISYNGKRIHMWILGKTSQSKEKARTLRLHLLRLHSELECLQIILGNIKNGYITPTPGTQAYKDLQSYFDEFIARVARSGSEVEEITLVAREANDVLNRSSREALLDSIRDLQNRTQNDEPMLQSVKTLVLNIIEENTMGDTINVSGGTGNIIKSKVDTLTQNIGSIPNADQATKDELQQLVKELSSILEKAKPEDAQKVLKGVDRLVKDVSEEQPDKDNAQITADGLKKAAENIAAVLPDVGTIVTKIVSTAMAIVGAIA